MARAICVLGMHRSGTSMVARCLNLLGVDLGAEERIAPPGVTENPAGFWELSSIKTLNEELLAALGGSWNDPPRLEPGWERNKRLVPFKERARAILRGEFPEADLWGWKDPRTSILLPFWQELVPDLSYVICLRHPHAVAESIARRGNELSWGRAHRLWMRYVVDALVHTQGERRLIVFYEDFFEDLDRQADALAAFLDLDPGTVDASTRERIRSFADQSLWRNRSNIEDDRRLAPEVRALWVALRAGVVAAEQPPAPSHAATETATSARGLLEDAGPRPQTHEEETARRTEKEFLEARIELRETRDQLRELGEELRHAQARVRDVEGSAGAGQASSPERGERHEDEAWRDARRDLATLASKVTASEAEAAHLQEILRSIEGSASWRITRPLRASRNVAARVRDRVRRKWRFGEATPDPARALAAAPRPFAVRAGPEAHKRRDVEPPVDMRGILRSQGAAESPSVDVVVCVHNALFDLHRCMQSVLDASDLPLRLIVVDDGSEPETAEYLDRFVAANPRVELRRHDAQRGYTVAANVGLRASTADYVVLLNSDTVVTRGWLRVLTAAGEENPALGIIGPLSNAASHQSVPKVRENGRWAVNELREWMTPDALALLVARLPVRAAVRVPFVNGFCYCIRRRVLEAIGYFDEDLFADGYAEENDFSRRAADAGFELAVASHAYVFHAKSRSYGPEGRARVAKRNYERFLAKHGAERIQALVGELERNPHLDAVRREVAQATNSPERMIASLPKLSVTFVLPGLARAGSGGSHSVYQEVSAMRSMRVEARIAVSASSYSDAEKTYGDARECFVPYADEDELVGLTARDDVVVATHFSSVPLVAASVDGSDGRLGGYYIQDYEPWISASAGVAAVRAAQESYTQIPDGLLFAKTDWVRRTVFEHQGVPVAKVEPSLDHSVFHSRGRSDGDGPVHLVAMVRPRTPRRAPAETLTVLARLAENYGSKVKLTTFGCRRRDLARHGRLPPGIDHKGLLSRSDVADLMRSADVFFDCSWYQAFGRTGLEAMACGATAVLPKAGGADEFAADGINALLVDTRDLDAAYGALSRLIDDAELRERLQASAVATATNFSALRSAVSEYALFCYELERRRSLIAS